MQAAEGDEALVDEYAAIDDRQVLLSLWSTEGAIGSGLEVTQRSAGANFSVDVAAGLAIVTGDDVAGQGTYLVRSDAVENVTIPSPPGAGERIHRVVAQVKDKLHNSGDWSTYEWTIDVLEDTGSGTPTLTDSAISLALVTVAAGQASVTNADIQDFRPNALSRPGRARLVADAASRPVRPVEAEEIWRQDLDCNEVYDGSAWREILRRDGGGSAWTTYTPALTATSSNPTLGSGATAQGRYTRYGRTVHVEVIIKFGTSGTGAGNGFYEVSLPVTARTQTVGRRTGSAYCYDNSEQDFYDGACFINTSETGKARVSIDSAVVGHGVPFSWSTNDELGFTLTYEAAS
ncbi:hypothetical protein SAMN04489713_104260 [Actinomadura madurae]|uniref:Uncharacterized protein n=2 Tax=Actinomadura madurae TaxID=1993 RepID=A0A1I5ESF0_9ACTN|nr:hypothetical protein SAMN04489713_104260 [Actinomadura madurae]